MRRRRAAALIARPLNASVRPPMDMFAQWLDVLTTQPLYNWLLSVLNSNFTAALAGALAGALAAQRIGDRAKQREALLQEIRATNAAIMLTFTICNAGLSLKSQQVKDIHDTYCRSKRELDDVRTKSAAGTLPTGHEFEFQADLRTLQMPVVPVDLLRSKVFDGVSAARRTLALTSALAGALDSLAETITVRNALVERYRSLGQAGASQLPAFYFGLPYGPGHRSTEFPDAIEALHKLTDDVIFFSELIGKDLADHGNQILVKYKNLTRRSEEKISSLDYSIARDRGLMPDATKYSDWLSAFPAKELAAPRKWNPFRAK